MTSAGDPTQRFTSRVEHYVRFRPGYPPEAIDWLMALGLTGESDVADVGSGTGILTQLLLERVRRVFAVEPNAAMRAAAESHLSGHPGFVSIEATAEATTLPHASVDMVLAAQAFHWFDPGRAVPEFRRILKPPRRLALVWNDRLNDTPFLQAYEALLDTHGTDYRAVNHQAQTDEQIRRLFVADFQEQDFDNHQHLDLEGLKGRLFSSSYTPTPQDPGYPAMVEAIEQAFALHNEAGRVTLRYRTRVFSGTL
jgi:SAM-dependent methyltransferase